MGRREYKCMWDDVNKAREQMVKSLSNFYNVYNLTLSRGDMDTASKMLSEFIDKISKMMLINTDFIHYNNKSYIEFLKSLEKGEVVAKSANIVIFWTITGGSKININDKDLAQIVKDNGGFMFGSQVAVGTGVINMTRYSYDHLKNMIPATYDSVKKFMKNRKHSYFVIDSSMDFDMFSEILFVTNAEKDLDLRKRIYLKTANGLRKFDSLKN